MKALQMMPKFRCERMVLFVLILLFRHQYFLQIGLTWAQSVLKRQSLTNSIANQAWAHR